MNALVRARLRDGGADRLADLLLDDLLDRPLAELIDARWLAERLVVSLRSAAADPRVERWFRDRVNDLRARVPAGPPPLPAPIRGPLHELLRRPYVPDRAIVGRLLDHDTARALDHKPVYLLSRGGFARSAEAGGFCGVTRTAQGLELQPMADARVRVNGQAVNRPQRLVAGDQITLQGASVLYTAIRVQGPDAD